MLLLLCKVTYILDQLSLIMKSIQFWFHFLTKFQKF